MNRFPLARAAAIVALALLVAISVLLAPARPIAAADTDDLLGTVIDAETKKPIVGALVSVWRTDVDFEPGSLQNPIRQLDWPKHSGRSVRTDVRGGFVFAKERRAGVGWFAVTAPGYAAAAVYVSGPGVAHTIALERAIVVKDRFLRCTATGTEPAAGVEVVVFNRIAGPSGHLLAARYTAGADGSVSVPAGTASVAFVRGPGIATMPHDFDLAAGSTVLMPGAPVTGTVVGPDGAPLAFALVELASEFSPGLAARADATGRFRIDGVPCGEKGLHLLATIPGLATAAVPVQGGMTGVEIVASAGARVRGRITDAAGKPVAGAVVRDIDPEKVREIEDMDPATMWRTVESAADGTFELSGVPPGIRTIEAIRLEKNPERISLWRATVDVGPRATVLDVPLTPVPEQDLIPVRILDDGGAPMAGVSVRCPPLKTPVTTGPDGTADVPARRNRETASIQMQLSGAGVGAAAVSAFVSPSRIAEGRTTIRVASSAALRISVKGADGETLAPTSVAISVSIDDASEVLTARGFTGAPRGDGAMSVPGGRPLRIVAVQIETGAFCAASVTPDPVKGADVALALKRPGVLRARGPASAEPIWGQAECRAPDGFVPLPTFLVSVPQPTREVMFNQLIPGEWTFTLSGSSYPLRVFAVRKETYSAAGGEVNLGELTVPTVLVQGTVRSRGVPVPGTRLGVTCGDGAELAVTTLPDGRYAFLMPAGLTARVTARSAGHAWISKTAAGAAAPVDFDLTPGATVVLLNGDSPSSALLPVTVRSAGVSADAEIAPRTGVAVVRGVAPGAVEIVVGEGKTARTIRVDAPAGKTTFVDLATAK